MTFRIQDKFVVGAVEVVNSSGIIQAASLPSGVVTADTYTGVTVDTYGRVTAGTKATYISTSTAEAIEITNATTSTTTATGALKVTGGVGILENLNVGGNTILTGNLTVNGTTTTVNSTVVTITDPVILLGGATAPETNDAKDRGVEFRWHNGTDPKIGFFGRTNSTGYLSYIPDATDTSSVFTGALGEIAATAFHSTTVSYSPTGTVTPKLWTTVISPDNVVLNTATVIDTWPIAGIRSAKYTIQVTQGTKFQMSEVHLVHDDTTVYLTNYAIVESNLAVPIPVTFTSTITTTTLSLFATITDAVTTPAAILLERTAIAVKAVA
jgi:hypothetical protein